MIPSLLLVGLLFSQATATPPRAPAAAGDLLESARLGDLARARELLGKAGARQGTGVSVTPLIQRNVIALCERNQKEVVVRCDATLTLPHYVADVRIHVVCDAASAERALEEGGGEPGWYVREVELIRGRTPTAQQQRGQGIPPAP